MSGDLVELMRGGRLASVLCRLARSGFTGLVYAEHESTSVAISIRDGRPVFVEDLGEQQSIPDALLEQGLISKEQYATIATHVLESQEDNEDVAFCKVAVAMRVLTAAQVDAEIQRRIRGRLIRAVEWEHCRIELDDDPDSVSGVLEHPQDVGALIYMGVRTFFDDDDVRALIGPGPQHYARLLRPIAEVLRFFELDPEEAALLAHVQPDAPLEPVIEEKAVDALDGWQLVCMLLLAEMIELQSTPFAAAVEPSGVRSTRAVETPAERGPVAPPAGAARGAGSRMRMPAVREEHVLRASQARSPVVREETGPGAVRGRAPIAREDGAPERPTGRGAALREDSVPRMPVAREEYAGPASRPRMPVAREPYRTPGSQPRMPLSPDPQAAPGPAQRSHATRPEQAEPPLRPRAPGYDHEASPAAIPRSVPAAGERSPSAAQRAAMHGQPSQPQSFAQAGPAGALEPEPLGPRPRRRPVRKLSAALQRLDRELKQVRAQPSTPNPAAQSGPAADSAHGRAHVEQLLRMRASALAQKSAPAGQTKAGDDFRLAQEALRDQQFGRAYEHLRKACEREPDNEVYSMFCMWAAFRSNNLPEEGVNKLRVALRARVSDDEHKAFAYYALGHISLAEKRDDLAEKFFKKAIELDKHNKDAERHLRIIELRRKTAASEQRANKIFGIEIGIKKS